METGSRRSSMTLHDSERERPAMDSTSRTSSTATKASDIQQCRITNEQGEELQHDLVEVPENPNCKVGQESSGSEATLSEKEKDKEKESQGKAPSRLKASPAPRYTRPDDDDEQDQGYDAFGNITRQITDAERGLAPKCDLRKVVTPKGELIYVGWDGPEDPANPKNWPHARKWFLSVIGFLFCSLVSISVSGYSIAVQSVQDELHTSHELAVSGISFFTLTFGAAPLIGAPLSEVWGRRWIYIISALIYTIFQIPQAVCQNIQTMLISRFIAGIGGSSAIALVGGTLSDLFVNEDRGIPMLVFSFAAFAPTGMGPVMFGYVTQYRGFRLVGWINFALAAVFTIALALLQQETREGALLSKKAARLRADTGDQRFVAQADEERASLATILRVSLTRPVKLFFTEPVLQAFTLWISFAWGVLYLMLISIPITFQRVYHFNLGNTGLAYSSQIVASVVGLGISIYTDKLYHRDVQKMGPEARMWTGMAGGIVFPIGCWMFTWTSFASVHWIAPMIGIAWLYCGLLLIYLTVFNYVADCYTIYAASALASMNVWRNTVGAAIPLFGTQMYDALGVQGAGSLVAAIATILSILPFVAFKYGGPLRARSRFAKELAILEGRVKA